MRHLQDSRTPSTADVFEALQTAPEVPFCSVSETSVIRPELLISDGRASMVCGVCPGDACSTFLRFLSCGCEDFCLSE